MSKPDRPDLAGPQYCYRLGLAEDTPLSGRVSISFTVDERAQVTEARPRQPVSASRQLHQRSDDALRFHVPKTHQVTRPTLRSRQPRAPTELSTIAVSGSSH